MKTCSHCGASKELREFNKDLRRPNAYRSKCKQCCLAANNAARKKRAEKNGHWNVLPTDPEKLSKLRAQRNASSKRDYVRRKEAINAYKRQWYAKNAEKRKAVANARYYAKHEECKVTMREYVKKHRAKKNASNVAYEMTKRRRTYTFGGKEFHELVMDEAYSLARLRTQITGVKWHVDHVVPMKSRLVSGLHTASNIQVIPGSANIRKGNRTWPNMPEVSPHV